MQTRVFRRPVYVWLPVAAASTSQVCAVLIAGPWDEEPTAAFAVAGIAIFFWHLDGTRPSEALTPTCPSRTFS
jgi:hypothetical protein